LDNKVTDIIDTQL